LLVRFRQGTEPFVKSGAHAAAQGAPVREYQIVDGLQLVKVPPWMTTEEAIARYLNHLDVLYAEPNYIVQSLATPNDPNFGDLWGLHNTGQAGGTEDADIDAPEAWDITTGSSNVVVAVIDTGIDYNHEDLAANMFQNSDDCNSNGLDDEGNGFVDDCHGIDKVNDDSDPMDDNDHGTHVAGTIGAVGDNNVGVVGVNWTVRLMACKFLDAGGSGTTADAISCLEYVKLMKDRGVNVVATNNSWGGGGFSQALFDAIEAHLQRGILLIAAAGNDGTDNDSSPNYPCNYYLPNVICVAATTRDDAIVSLANSTFGSNFGRRTVHLGAPGKQILSTVPPANSAEGDKYAFFSGTSMATPHVTGVAALLKAQDSSRDWKAIKNLILAGGDNNSNLSNTITQKRLNAYGAMTCSNSVVQSRLRPIGESISGTTGTPIDLAVLHINCASPNGNVTVTVTSGGQTVATVTLLDDGAAPDQASGDGIYSNDWTPTSAGTYTLAFPGGDNVTVDVSGSLPATKIGVTPSERNFGDVIVGQSEDRTFTVKNVGSGTLSGSASVSSPFSIVSGGSYDIAAGDSHTVTVRFSPTAAGPSGNFTVSFTGGGGANRTVRGTGVTANYLLTVSKSGSGSGTVTTTGINCGSDCKQAYSSGSSVTLTASASSGSVFSGWSGGGCSGTGSCTVTMSADTTVTAAFNLSSDTFTLSATVTGSASGTVTSSPAGINCGSDCSEVYAVNTDVTLTATAGSGGSFKGWSGDCSGSSTTCSVFMSAAKSVTATFSKTYTDDPITSQSTPIKAAHITELRQAINTLRSNNGLSSFSFTDSTLTAGSTQIKAVHITELRTALNGVYDAQSKTKPTYTDPTVTAGQTTVKKAHIAEIRQAVKDAE
jgi:subtilisin family serine protease